VRPLLQEVSRSGWNLVGRLRPDWWGWHDWVCALGTPVLEWACSWSVCACACRVRGWVAWTHTYTREGAHTHKHKHTHKHAKTHPRPARFARLSTHDPQTIEDGRTAYPSGHAAEMFAAMTVTSLYLLAKTRLFVSAGPVSFFLCVVFR
jgi:membrane-associated phospholipid phosphatase